MDEKFDETVKEILSEIDELGHSSSERVEHIYTFESGSSLEQEKAQEVYDQIREDTILESENRTSLGSLINPFERFEPTSSTLIKESEKHFRHHLNQKKIS